jgi:hypothetical protein
MRIWAKNTQGRLSLQAQDPSSALCVDKPTGRPPDQNGVGRKSELVVSRYDCPAHTAIKMSIQISGREP